MPPRASAAAGITRPGEARVPRFPAQLSRPPSSDFPDGQLTYRDALNGQPHKELTVMLEDVIAHDPDLAKELRARPEVYVPVLERARSRPWNRCGSSKTA